MGCACVKSATSKNTKRQRNILLESETTQYKDISSAYKRQKTVQWKKGKEYKAGLNQCSKNI